MMFRYVDAIFTPGAFQLLEPLGLPEGTRVLLSVEAEVIGTVVPPAKKVCSPRLAHLQDAPDFVMVVRGNRDASV